MAITLIRKNNSDAVTAEMDAAMYYMTLGEGVFADIYGSCNASESNYILSISSGLISLGGRLVEIPENETVTLDLSSYASKTVYIKCNITIESDDSNSSVTIYASTDGTESTRGALVNTGTYTTNLFLLTPSGNTHLVARVLNLLTVGTAKNASTLLKTGKIGNTLVTDIFDFNTDGSVKAIKSTEYSDYADYAYGLSYVSDGNGHNLNAVSSGLYMQYRGVYLCVDSVIVNNVTKTASEIKAMNTAVTIESDSNTVPFDYGAKLDSINRFALMRLFVDGKAYDTYGTGRENYSSFIFSNVDDLTKVEVVLKDSESKAFMRFGSKASKAHTFSLHVIGMGVTF